MPAAFAASLACITFVIPALANTAPSPSVAAGESALGEVVVTAQRRQESLQQTPVSVTAITGQQLTDFGARDFVDYAKSVPDLSFGMGGSPFGGPAYGFSSTRQIVIRGVAGANTTSLYIDDTPIPNVVDPRVFDLERIEVLRGPQGTLFGGSSMGGTVRLITKTPDSGKTGGNVDLQAFDINAGGAGYDISGSANVALVEHNAALRLNMFDAFDPGYFTRAFGIANVPGVDFAAGTRVSGSTKVGDTHEYGGTVSLLITPEALPGLAVTPMVMLQRRDANGYPVADDNASNLTQVRPLNVAERSLAQWQLYAFTAKYATSFGDLIASTGYLHRYSQDVEDGTMWFAAFQRFYYSPLPYLAATVLQTYQSREVTQELRFRSHLQGSVQLSAGFFYQRAATNSPFSYPTPGLNAASGYALGSDNLANITQNTRSKQTAGFADITYSPLAKLELSAGVRKTWLDDTGYQALVQPPSLDADSAYSYEQKQHPVTPRFAAKYSFDSGNMTYVSASKGFRNGGENAPETGPCADGARMLGLPTGVPVPYYSDSLWSYEIGLKNLWNAQKIASRAAAYYIDWKDMQQTVLLPVCGIPALLNAGAARIVGAEWETSARITPRLQLDVGLGYEDGKITAARTLSNGQVLGFPVETPLSGVPKWTASLRASYTIATSIGDAFVRGEYSFVGSSLSLANGGTGLYRGEYSLLDLRGGLQFSDWTATLFIKNVFNRAANYGDIVGAAGVIPGQTRLVTAQPRTIALELRRNFGMSRVIGSYDGG
jgi:iron complex outermembrane recepter protein